MWRVPHFNFRSMVCVHVYLHVRWLTLYSPLFLQFIKKSFSIASAEFLFIQNIVRPVPCLFPHSISDKFLFSTADFAKRIQWKIPNLLLFISMKGLTNFLHRQKSTPGFINAHEWMLHFKINLVSKYASDTFWLAITWFTLCTLQFFFVFHFFLFPK